VDVRHKEPETLWDYIKYLRERENLTLHEFAKKINCHYFHATTIEKDFKVSGRTASAELLKEIAKVCSHNAEERKKIEYNLTLRRARIFFQKEVAGSITLTDLKAESFISAESMPVPLIERLRTDIANLEDKKIINKLSITKYALDSILAGKYLLSKRKVSEIAKKFKQPEYEYLLLAGYIPDFLYRVINNPDFEHFIHRSKNLSDNDIEKAGTALTNILNLILHSNKKKEG
jgi:transcriptional regulator with XRE-family HTH domain